MYHSITFGDKNTWDDWHLIPKSRPLFNPPAPKTYFVDVPGGMGSLDLTELHTGSLTYKDRSGSWEFYVQNGYGDWATRYSEIMEYLHGKRMKAILEDDPEYYYEGRFSVNAWKSDSYWSIITIDYQVKPYKRHYLRLGDDWLWDSFSFENGVICALSDLTVNESLKLTVEGSSMPASLTVVASAGVTSVACGTRVCDLNEGVNYVDEIVIREGQNELMFTGNGTVSVLCEKGRL